jgi:two-component system sensor histidine kinase RpfC
MFFKKVLNGYQEGTESVELEQSLLRLVLVLAGIIYAVFLVETGLLDFNYDSPIFIIGYLYIGFSVSVAIYVYLYPQGSSWRHTIHMSLDILVITLVMHSLEEYGIPIFAEYLWLVVGNGFRYGYKEAIICAFMSFFSFIIVVATTPFWINEILLTTTCIILLSIIPLYVSIMLKRLQYEKQRAEMAIIEKSRFLANISHELRTPLNAIVGFSELMDKVSDDAQKVQLVKRIQDASASLLALVEDVLDFSRIEAGHVELADEAVNIFKLAVSIQDMFDSQARHKNISLVLDIASTVKPIIRSDEQRLRQILVNLVGNAVKFTQQGRVIIKISNTEIATASGLQVEVIDTGEGIPTEVQPYIFERFRQADNSVSRRYGGTGLGTSIAKHLVELMGGEIGLESEYGKGSRFWIRIPMKASSRHQERVPVLPAGAYICIVGNDAHTRVRIRRAIDGLVNSECTCESLSENEAEYLDTATESARCVIADCGSLSEHMIERLASASGRDDNIYIAYDAGNHERLHLLELGYQQIICSCSELDDALAYAACRVVTARGLDLEMESRPATDRDHAWRVLVAEDSDMNRQVFKGILGYMGLDVNFANNGIEALKRLKEEVFDLLIVDIQMPGMSGFEVITRCKSLFSGKPRIPIVVVTGDVTKEVQDECNELGVDRFLSKPVESERLRGVVYELLTG